MVLWRFASIIGESFSTVGSTGKLGANSAKMVH